MADVQVPPLNTVEGINLKASVAKVVKITLTVKFISIFGLFKNAELQPTELHNNLKTPLRTRTHHIKKASISNK